MGELLHYGKILKANISEMGLNKTKIYTVLGMCARTFEKRLEDGKFSFDELKQLKYRNWI